MKNFFRDTIDEIQKIIIWFPDTYRDIKYGIQNLIKWLPVIWRDRHWDHTYIYNILKKKLEMQSHSIRKYGNHLSSDRDADNMMKCVYALNRLTNDIHGDMAFKRHYEIWGHPNFRFETIDGEWSELHIDYPNVVNENDKKKERKHFSLCCTHEDMLKKQDVDYLFNMIRKHITSWWD